LNQESKRLSVSFTGLRIGLAARRAHHLADEKLEHAFVAGAILRQVVPDSSRSLHGTALDLARVADLRESSAANDFPGGFTRLKHPRETLLTCRRIDSPFRPWQSAPGEFAGGTGLSRISFSASSRSVRRSTWIQFAETCPARPADDAFNAATGKKVFARMFETGKPAGEIIAAEGFAQVKRHRARSSAGAVK